MSKVMASLATLALIAAISACGAGSTDPPDSSPDPGGRILAELQTAAAAVPSDASVIYRHDVEPQWDSCDGRADTYGWDDVVVQIHFNSPSSPGRIFGDGISRMAALGWSVSYQHGDTDLVWTRRLRNGTEGKAALSNVGGWTLYASAPPVGPRVRGC